MKGLTGGILLTCPKIKEKEYHKRLGIRYGVSPDKANIEAKENKTMQLKDEPTTT